MKSPFLTDLKVTPLYHGAATFVKIRLALVEQLTSVPTCGSSISYICMYLECILKIVGQISNEQKMMEICLRWFGQVRRIPMEASLRSEKSESN